MNLKYIWLTFIPEFTNKLLINIFIKRFKKIKIQDEQYILRRINTQDDIYQIEFINKKNESLYSQPALTIRDAILNSLVMISNLSTNKPTSESRALQFFRAKLNPEPPPSIYSIHKNQHNEHIEIIKRPEDHLAASRAQPSLCQRM